VLLEIGGNDVLGNTSDAEFEVALDQLLSTVCAPDREVVMFELPLPPLRNAVGRIQRRLAAEYRVTLIPKRILMGVIRSAGATSDSLHLTPKGHERMADAVWHIIDQGYDHARTD